METQSQGERIPVHETLVVGLLLSIVGGYLEAYTFLLRGEVFCNAQTGNFALMILSLAQGDFRHAMYYPIPIGAFFVGILFTAAMGDHLKGRRYVKWEHILIIIESILLFCAGFVPLGPLDGIANVTISFVCSMQFNTFRQTKGLPYATTFCTGNLRLAAESVYKWKKEKTKAAARRCLRYGSILLAFCTGVFLGALLARPLGPRAIWICSGLLLLVLGILLYGTMGKPKGGEDKPCQP